MSKDSQRLGRLGVLAPAALSACMDASVLAVPAAGAIVSTVLKELSKAFMLKKWYHGMMSTKEAETLIMQRGKNGSFLVRESQAHPGEYVLSVRVRGHVSHVMIRHHHNKYDVGSGEKFDDLVGLIEHFRLHPMIETSGNVIRLLQPVSGTCRSNDAEALLQDMQDMEELQKLESKRGIDSEFYTLKMLEQSHVFTTFQGMKPENAAKNRYRNILPYDQTRVVLRKRDSRSGTNYINANYIRSYKLCISSDSIQSSNESLDSIQSSILRNELKRSSDVSTMSDTAVTKAKLCDTKLDKANSILFGGTVKDKIYIATQGCLPSTVNDFWRMIWQEDIRVIVMITNEFETGRKKCERYWPLLGEDQRFDNFTIKSITEASYENYLLREFDFCNNKKQCRFIYQYQFTAWPDHDTPAETDGVLAFIDTVNRRMYQIVQGATAPRQNTICVHCSAGVGRTGTFVVLDMLIDKIKSSGFSNDINVQDTVKMVRAQRSGMVQNIEQYRFIYRAVQDYINSTNLKMKKKVNASDA